MNKTVFLCSMTLLLMSATPIMSASQSMFIGTIQFPATIKKVPNLRIWYGGHKITGETNNRTKQLIFSIPEIGESKKFHIVISDSIQFEMEEDADNTAKYMKIGNNKPYKCCEIVRMKQEQSFHTNATYEYTGSRPLINESKVAYSWKITKKGLDNNRQLPENAIVICFPSDYVDRIEGGNKSELPRIMVKQDLLERVGSEQKLHDQATELLLSAINFDTMHTKITQEIKNQPTKTIIACKTCG